MHNQPIQVRKTVQERQGIYDVEDIADSYLNNLAAEWVNLFGFLFRHTGYQIHKCEIKFTGFQGAYIHKTCKICGKEFLL